MNNTYSPKGQTFARLAIVRALALSPSEQHAIAATRWGNRSAAAEMLLKSGVSGGDSTSLSELADTRNVSAEFLELVRPRTILGKLQGLRNVPAKTPFVAMSTGATAYWTEQGKATLVSAHTFNRDTMFCLKISALVVLANALLNSADPKAENLIRLDLARACAELSDRTFIDISNTGIEGKMPASVTNDATTIPATTDFADDVANAIESFQGDLETAAWVMNPKLAAIDPARFIQESVRIELVEM